MPRGRPKKSDKFKVEPAKQTAIDFVIKSTESSQVVNNPLVEKNNKQAETVINIVKETEKSEPFNEIPSNLKRTVNDLNKQFGHEIIHLASEEKDRERIPTGIDQIDKLIGGGISEGMFSVLWGNKSSTKTTLSYLIIAQAQKKGKTCLYIDLENSFDKVWAEKMGIDPNNLFIARFPVAEEAFDSIIKLANEKCVDLIVLDSIQSLSPKGEKETKTGKERSVEDDTMALLARKLSQFFRMTAHGVAKGKVAMLLIGQARTDLGSFIKLDALSGGHALQHWSSITLKAYRGSKADAPRYKFKVDGKSKEIIIGFSLNIKIEKTKVSGTAPESSVATLPFYYEYGFIKPTEEQIKQTFGDWIEFEQDE